MVGKKSVLVFGVLGLFLFSMFSFVLAQDSIDSRNNVITSAANEFNAGPAGTLAEFLQNNAKINPKVLSSVLLGLLLYIIIYSFVTKALGFKRESGTLFHFGSIVVSLVVVVLSFLYIPENFIDSIVLQYGAMGMAIVAIVPYLIMLYYTLDVVKNRFAAKAVWLFYVVYYTGLFVYRVGTNGWTSWLQNVPYMGAIAVGLVMLFWIAPLRDIWFKEHLEGVKEKKERNMAKRLALDKSKVQEFDSGAGI